MLVPSIWTACCRFVCYRSRDRVLDALRAVHTLIHVPHSAPLKHMLFTPSDREKGNFQVLELPMGMIRGSLRS